MRSGLIVEEDSSLFLKEVFPNNTKFVKLCIVPRALRNLIYVTFHANPIGCHLNAYRTYFRIRLQYFWPGIFQSCKKLTCACPGCALSNITSNRSSELVYSFPIDALMNVLHVDIYAVGVNLNYEGNRFRVRHDIFCRRRGNKRAKFYCLCIGTYEDLATVRFFSHHCC